MNPNCVLLHCLAAYTGLQAVNGIIAGKYANEGDYPFAIVILKDNKVICGGVLVTHEHVFTGCHCVGWWSETSESSTVAWEPDKTAYYFNISTPDSKKGRSHVRPFEVSNKPLQLSLGGGDRKLDLRSRNNGKSTTKISTEYAEYTMDSWYENRVQRENKPSSNADRPPSSPSPFASTGNPFGSQLTPLRHSIATSAHHLYRRQPSANTSSTVPTTAVPKSTNGSSANNISTVSDEINTPVFTGNVTVPAAGGKFNPFVLTEVNMVAGTVWIYKFSRGQLRRAGNSFKHPRCKAETIPWDYDFGIYRANAPFQLDEKRLYPMRIYHRDNEIFSRKFQSMIEEGAMCQTIGWGATQLLKKSGNPYDHTFNRTAVNMSEKLKHTDVKLVNDELCNELLCFPPYNFCNGTDFLWAEVGIVCAIHVSRGDSCDIDDGNALICDGHVFGFANSGLDCWANIPRFYTRLDYALDFYYSSVNSGVSSYLISLLVAVTAVIFIKSV